MSNMKLEFILWRDARGVGSEWFDIEETEPCIAICKSVGWVGKETKEFIQVIPHVTDRTPTGCGDMTIPKQAIVKRVVLREPKP